MSASVIYYKSDQQQKNSTNENCKSSIKMFVCCIIIDLFDRVIYIHAYINYTFVFPIINLKRKSEIKLYK